MNKYITFAKTNNPPYGWVILNDKLDAGGCPLETRKINIKHTDILDAYLKDKSIEIEATNYISKDSDLPSVWYSVNKFIDSYDENLEYRLKSVKPKNNFKDYGFEADFEGEILKEVKNYYIGYVYIGGHTYGLSWDKNGSTFNTSDEKYNLKPIKKEWYENSDNFPTLVVSNNKKILYVNKYQYTKENNTHWVIYEEMGEDIYSLNLEYHRPATKEEVLALLVKE